VPPVCYSPLLQTYVRTHAVRYTPVCVSLAMCAYYRAVYLCVYSRVGSCAQRLHAVPFYPSKVECLPLCMGMGMCACVGGGRAW
jgi:hypothetical protein